MDLFPVSNFDQMIDGQQVLLYHLQSDKLKISVTNYGGILVQLLVLHENQWVDVVQGYETLDEYLSSPEQYFGAIVGPICNRVENAQFVLDGNTIHLPKNKGEHCLHSNAYLPTTIFTCEQTQNEISLRTIITQLSPSSPYPGPIDVTIIYKIINNALKIKISAVSQQKTAIAFTAHPFFCLSQQDSLNEIYAQVKADQFIGLTKDSISGSKIDAVGSFDFNKPRHVFIDPQELDTNEIREQLLNGFGYDHCFVLNSAQNQATFSCENLKMHITTNQPGLHFYTGNYLNNFKGKYGRVYGKNSSFCAECQNFPNAVNRSDFPKVYYEKGEEYVNEVVYTFE
ncbi:Aldose_1-epimerase [Hexamita inflata]|uniref:Aldose 1-epimerase n=1 Tax=Hexamita inflata TaxID=28002 RepID=A0AA86Q2T0_9EUKA|nr:Aldose 1-epimerase [Hexamita inflata]